VVNGNEVSRERIIAYINAAVDVYGDVDVSTAALRHLAHAFGLGEEHMHQHPSSLKGLLVFAKELAEPPSMRQITGRDFITFAMLLAEDLGEDLPDFFAKMLKGKAPVILFHLAEHLEAKGWAEMAARLRNDGREGLPG